MALLRLPTLSSPGFELSASKAGPATPLPPAAVERLRLLLALVAEHAQEASAAAAWRPVASAQPPLLVRHQALRRTFRAPPLPGASVANSEREVQLYALIP